MVRRSPMRSSKRPFPPGFTPVPDFNTLSINIPREESEPIFLSPTLRSPILNPENSEYPSLESTSDHSCSSTSYSKSQSESFSRPSTRKIKLICQSVLNLKKSRSRIDLSEALVEEKPSRQEKILSTSPLISYQTEIPSSKTNLNQSNSYSEGQSIPTYLIEGSIEKFQPEPIEELETEAILKAECERGHRRQRSNELSLKDQPLLF
ncbi:hypothetical protein DFH28DRAFT_419601 [Melampsora americana]|nr:hypothetical protein DFH28DRAFT_419601 [Melampsora americana]